MKCADCGEEHDAPLAPLAERLEELASQLLRSVVEEEHLSDRERMALMKIAAVVDSLRNQLLKSL